ncbi:hypothetical protein [Formosa algae]|uniref:Uncharacterized protein n=1 Tax=Formosa algae TaxID=225843 RepID=A0A9X0YP34_9FLAO|nr:hypothetical protein [Formosa algae]MBP1840777.1 hypothetical protein [Formosa algae]MDQ0336326.1 hypothetical protein [Formosa algae]
MNHTLRITFLIVIFIFNSCGYQRTEEDKHPEIPIFPKHTNNKISIKEFPFYLTNIKYNQKHVFANNKNGDWLILDRKFNTIKQLNKPSGYVHSYISNDGTIYFLKPKEKTELNEVYKFSIQDNFKKEKLENLILKSREGVTIRDSLNAVYKNQTNKHIDSLTSDIYKKEEKLIAESIKKLNSNLISIFPLTNGVSVLKYENKAFALYTRYDHTNEFKAVLEKTQQDELKPIWHLEKSPKSFGKVTLGNSFSGNHYVGGYTPYGYNYVELSLNNETTKFKAKNSNNGNGVNILYKSKDTIIINDFEKLYYITLKK